MRNFFKKLMVAILLWIVMSINLWIILIFLEEMFDIGLMVFIWEQQMGFLDGIAWIIIFTISTVLSGIFISATIDVEEP